MQSIQYITHIQTKHGANKFLFSVLQHMLFIDEIQRSTFWPFIESHSEPITKIHIYLCSKFDHVNYILGLASPVQTKQQKIFSPSQKSNFDY